MNAVELKNLRKIFELRVGSGFKRSKSEVVAVHGVTLEVPKGPSLALIGPNGAGKSTLNAYWYTAPVKRRRHGAWLLSLEAKAKACSQNWISLRATFAIGNLRNCGITCRLVTASICSRTYMKYQRMMISLFLQFRYFKK